MVGVDVLWGHGYGFDVTIMEDMLRQSNKPIPWQFWQVRDSRTLFCDGMKVDPRKSMQSVIYTTLLQMLTSKQKVCKWHTRN
jgi:hypothetical protein